MTKKNKRKKKLFQFLNIKNINKILMNFMLFGFKLNFKFIQKLSDINQSKSTYSVYSISSSQFSGAFGAFFLYFYFYFSSSIIYNYSNTSRLTNISSFLLNSSN